jgi:hypothetical protein
VPLHFVSTEGFIPDDRGKTVTKPLALSRLGLLLSEKQIPQVVENLESGVKRKEALERTIMRPRQVRYAPTFAGVFILSYFPAFSKLAFGLQPESACHNRPRVNRPASGYTSD